LDVFRLATFAVLQIQKLFDIEERITSLNIVLCLYNKSEDHLQKWVAIDGEQELKLQKWQRQGASSLLLSDLRRPLTVEDYLESSPNKQGS
jgi:hypothetical protein